MGRLLSMAERLIKIEAGEIQPLKDRSKAQLPRFASVPEFAEWLGMKPYRHQLELMDCSKRFRVDVVHRRGGKSYAKIVLLLARALACPFKDGRFIYLAPTFNQAEDIAWAYLCEMAAKIPGSRPPQKNKLAITVPNWSGGVSRIRLYGADSQRQTLRGGYADGLVIDEAQKIPETMWAEVVRPMLADQPRQGLDHLGLRNQWAHIIGTPLGHNWFYRLWHRAHLWHQGLPARGEHGEALSTEWAASLFTVHDTGVLSQSEIDELQASMSPTRFAQEFLCSFEAGVEGAVFLREMDLLREQGRIGKIDYNPSFPVNVSFDLGWDDQTAIWYFQQPTADTVLFIDYDELRQTSIPDIAVHLAQKPYHYGKFYVPHDASVHELGVGKSRAAIMIEHGIRPLIKAPRAKLHDQIAASRDLLMRAWFDASACSLGLDRLRTYRRKFNEELGTFSADVVHDEASHGSSAFATAAMCITRADPMSRVRGAIM